MKLLLHISHNGTVSRRKAFDLIQTGKVQVNGKTVIEPSAEVDPVKDKVTCYGRPVVGKKLTYIVMNKPVGYVTTCEGQFSQRTVMDLLPKEFQHLKPVGRLDKDTEGLLIFTNDGELANKLSHPRFDVDKTYFVKSRFTFSSRSGSKLEAGVMIDGEKTAPAKVKILRTGKDESEFELTIHEGKKHQVRNMCQAVGNPVIRLRRLRQGPISLDNLRSADWRHLNDVEVAALQSIRAIPAERMPLPKPFPVKKPFRSPSSARPFKSMRSGSDTRPSEPLRSPADSRGSYGRPFARSADSAASPMGASRPSQQRRSSFIKPRKPAFTR